MATPSPRVTAVLASLRERWGEAAPRWGGEVAGALALAPAPLPGPEEMPDPGAGLPIPQLVPAVYPEETPSRPRPFDEHVRAPARPAQPDGTPRLPGLAEPNVGKVVSTGFPSLDAILGPGGIPRDASVALRGDHSSGKTTLALRLAAEAQAGGAIVAWLDVGASFDPVEAVARGVRLEWLVVLTPESLAEGLAMAGALVQGRAIDLLLVDLSTDRATADASPNSAGSERTRPRSSRPGGRPPTIADRLQRLTALARRTGTLLVVLEPPGLSRALDRAVGEVAGLRLELARRSWIRLGRDVVGQRTEAVVARNRFGPPDRRAELRILYAEGGDRDTCLERIEQLEQPGQPARLEPLGTPAPLVTPALLGKPAPLGKPAAAAFDAPIPLRPVTADATSPPLLATPSAPPRRAPGRHALSGRPDRPRRAALDRRSRTRHGPGRARAGRPARDAARERASARA